MIRKLIFYALLACLWYPAANAADGIKPGVHFRVPFYVDGVAAINRATATTNADGTAMLRVLFVKGDTIVDAVYRLERIDTPDPDPDPDPDPLPPPTNLWGIVVEESLNRTPEHAAVYASPAVRALFDNKRFRVLDKDPPVSPDMEPYRKRAVLKVCPTGVCPSTLKDFPPVLFLAGQNGTIYYEGSVPNSIAGMVELVERIKGGGK